MDWNNRFDDLLRSNVGVNKKKEKLHPGPGKCSQQLDEDLLAFMTEKRDLGIAVSQKMLRDKILEIAQRLNIPQFHSCAVYSKDRGMNH